jgi:hypothetical protein
MAISTDHMQHTTAARPRALADYIKYRDMIGLDVTLKGLGAASLAEASTSLFMAELDVASKRLLSEVLSAVTILSMTASPRWEAA